MEGVKYSGKLIANPASRIKGLLNEKGMRQVDLVEATGIEKANISRYVNGRMKPAGANLIKLCKTLDCNEQYLLGYDVPQEPLSWNPITQELSWVDVFSGIGSEQLAMLKKINQDEVMKARVNAYMQALIDSMK
jgi:DNA-binding Xre family transcriptional regulator